MKQALISPLEQIQQVKDWIKVDNKWMPVFTVIPDSARIAETTENPFEVAEPLFWVECQNNIIADKYYYNLISREIILVPDPVPMPIENQAVVTGAQQL